MSKRGDLPLILNLKKDAEKYSTKQEKTWKSLLEKLENSHFCNLEKAAQGEVVPGLEEVDLNDDNVDEEYWSRLGASSDPSITSDTSITFDEDCDLETEIEPDFLEQLQQHQATFIELRERHNKEGDGNEIGFFDDRLFPNLSKDTHSDQSTKPLEYYSTDTQLIEGNLDNEKYCISPPHPHLNVKDFEIDFLSSPLLKSKLKTSSNHENIPSSSPCHETTTSSCEISISLTEGGFDDGFLAISPTEEKCSVTPSLNSRKLESDTSGDEDIINDLSRITYPSSPESLFPKPHNQCNSTYIKLPPTPEMKTSKTNRTNAVESSSYSEDGEDEIDELHFVLPKHNFIHKVT